ncbi:DNA helicase-2 / ATP-dependent DNA helicase PcrA [Alkalispirochaeta americana]|uniref:DNA 3'-5' helicase n=1 Tax=Alkalispirochaeta americana TaxID=159291 RepID=A0A1N6T208_9SPIO|nr:UvrD-helicase domain-containing protein [Alkalispirochaeta americana]SIQ47360.1 DNA helicase-2 / ATP-dependent DNA helicase PcrA [Alkalispirochaeta americana]
MDHLLERLNPQQRDAVLTIDGPLLIIAGAGSGKTGVITTRISYMLSQGIPPESILAMTFTNKAAGEMKERIKELLGGNGGKTAAALTISTFHAFGLAVLRRYGRLLGYRPNFTVYDTGDQVALLKEAARELRIDPEELEIYNLLQLFSGVKTERITWQDERWYAMLNPSSSEKEEKSAGVRGISTFQDLYRSYQEHLITFNAVDFDDLIMQPLTLFREHPKVRGHYADLYRYVLVDEFQDTSTPQYNLLYQIAQEWKNVCVVGDDDQSIYSWRGADYSNIERFEKDFPQVREIKLERNYRSTGGILSAANAVIANNTNRKEKALWTQIDGGNPLELSFPDDDGAEASFIAEKIKLAAYQESLAYDSFGILIRTNSQARVIEEALLEADIPYRMSGGQSFFQRKEIKDIAGYLRIVLNPDDDVSLLRTINTPRRGIGRRTVEALHQIADERKISLYSAITLAVHNEAEHTIGKGPLGALQEYLELIESYQERFSESKHLAATTERLATEVDYWGYLVQEFQKSERAAKAKWKNIGFFIRSIDRYEQNPDVLEPTLQGYLNRISLQTRDELSPEEAAGKVNLMTIHAAKGLEFDVVFLAGVEEGIIPHQRAVEESEGNLEEERRLFYVAITRARQQLYMTSCRRRQVQGEMIEALPSPFIEEIPAELMIKTVADPAAGMEIPEDPFAALKAQFGA